MGGNGTASDDWMPGYRLPVGKWTLLTGVMNCTHKVFYVNGVLFDSKSFPYCPVIGSEPLEIGRFPKYQGEYFNGTIDEVRIYNRALTPEEVWQLYQIGQTRIKAGNYYYRNSTSDNVLFAVQNFRTAYRGSFADPKPSYFNLTENTTTKTLTYSYTFNSTLNKHFMFVLGTSGSVNTSINTTNFANEVTLGFSAESLEQVVNSSLTYYDLRDDSLVLYLDFDEGIGNVAYDLSLIHI